ncbi:MAG: DUF4405 domain-containing protein [Anaerolineae bacterium]|nr:DUF4405 domain-containing protein [Anaerolineae bacterium]
MTAIAQAQTAPRRFARISKNRLNLYLDLMLVLAFVVDLELRFTGLQIHELLGVFFGAALVIHLILHWSWIVSLTRTFFKKLVHESRLNYVLNIALFADVATLVVTGILISRTLGLDLSAVQQSSRAIEQIHRLTADLSLLIVALHVALHWKWIVTHARKYLLPGRQAAH